MVEKNFKTEKKDEIRTLDNSGNVVTVYRIWATSTGGTYFHVDVPEKDLTKADTMLTAKAKVLDAI